jgi:hypothetical protein
MSITREDLPEAAWEWFDALPEIVQKRVLEYPPGEPYLLKTTGHVVRMIAYTETNAPDEEPECDECRVVVLQGDNAGRLHEERQVFGIPFDELGPVPEDYDPPGDRPIEELPEEMRNRIPYPTRHPD